MKIKIIFSVLSLALFTQAVSAAGNFVVKNMCNMPLFIDISGESSGGNVSIRKKVDAAKQSEIIDLEKHGTELKFIMIKLKPSGIGDYKLDFESQFANMVQPEIGKKNFIEILCTPDGDFVGDFRDNFAVGKFTPKKAFTSQKDGWRPQQ